MFVITAFIISLAVSALGDVYITSPTGSSTFTGGQQASVKWQDDGTSPSLAQFGAASIAIYVGNAIQQTQLQVINGSVNVATTSSIQFVPNPSIGPDSNEYFIRIQSLSYMNPQQPQYPALSFSSKFTLTGMSGSFTSAEQAEINGQSTAPLQGPTSTPSSNSGAPTAPTTTHASAAATATTTSNGANGQKSGSICLQLLVAVVGATLF